MPPSAEEPGLERTLGARDIALFAITCIVGTRWLPAAARGGTGAIVLWLAAAVFFVVPLAIAVGALTLKYRGAAGGLYVWTRDGFGPRHGFLCAWVYWLSIAFWFPGAAVFYMSAGFQALGPEWARLGESRPWLLGVSLAAIWVALGVHLAGLRFGKWMSSAGAAASWLLGAVLVALAALVWARRGPASPLAAFPRWEWGTVGFWATIAYALSGLELAGMMGGEIRDPERTLPRAGWIASAVSTAFYCAGTAALLVLLPPGAIGELTGLAQAGEAASGVLGGGWIAPTIAVLVLASALGQIGGIGAAVSRLPFAVAADGLLPAALARVHLRWRTPHVSILCFGAVSSFLLIAMQAGDTPRGAYLELVSLMVVTGFLPYLYIFGGAWKMGHRLSSLSGLAVTVTAILCAVVPPAGAGHPWLFEAKIAGGTAAAIGSALLIVRRATTVLPVKTDRIRPATTSGRSKS